MSTGLFILLNFCVIPFLNEFESIGTTERRLPSVAEVVVLRRTRCQRWFFGYLVLLALRGAIALAPPSSGESQPLSTATLVLGLACQAAAWWRALHRAKQAMGGK